MKDPLTPIRRWIRRRSFKIAKQDKDSILFVTENGLYSVLQVFGGKWVIRAHYNYYIGCLPTEEEYLCLYNLCNEMNSDFQKIKLHVHWAHNNCISGYCDVFVDLPLNEEAFLRQGEFSHRIRLLDMIMRKFHLVRNELSTKNK